MMTCALWIAWADEGSPTNTIVVTPKPALAGLLRNPAMGWVLYSETLGSDLFRNADDYWKQADPSVPSASIFYIRCTWAQMEPEEGHYAWKEDANFQELIDGAFQRHLKLAFRVVTNSKDCRQQATPDWVHAAGADGYTEKGTGGRDLWTPSVKDPVFREKLEKFVQAFAKEFDDPSRVDFIDGCGLGWWGEMHHLNIDSTDNWEVYEWICHTYGAAFHRVLLGTQVFSPLSNFGKYDDMAFYKYGYVARRDSLGSSWMPAINRFQELYPKIPFFGESCYFALDTMGDWKKDHKNFQTVRDVLQAAYNDAIACHANTLDLREPRDAAVAMREASDLVASFIAKGGYRLYPVSVEFPPTFTANQPVIINHTWKNLGVGIMANDNPRWNRKYHVAFALLDPVTEKVVATAVDPDADPGTWVTDQEESNVYHAQFLPPPAPNHYLLATAIVNTLNGNQPEIQLATTDLQQSDGWSILGDINVGTAKGTGP